MEGRRNIGVTYIVCCIFGIPIPHIVPSKLKVKLSYCFIALAVVVLSQSAWAQSSKDQAEARALYRQVNSAAAGPALRAALTRQGSGFFGGTAFQSGALRTFDNRYRPVPGLRYHAGLRMVEAQDSIDTDSTHLWPVGSLRGFDLGEPGGEVAPRRFRPHLVKEGSAGIRRDFVEVLTAVDAGPLLLAWLYTSGADATAGRLSLMPLLLVGPGSGATEPLRPIELNQTAVLRLFGARTGEIRSFANGQKLRYDQPTEVARMIDYFNRVAVVK